jgi:hypothetical protein
MKAAAQMAVRLSPTLIAGALLVWWGVGRDSATGSTYFIVTHVGVPAVLFTALCNVMFRTELDSTKWVTLLNVAWIVVLALGLAYYYLAKTGIF